MNKTFLIAAAVLSWATHGGATAALYNEAAIARAPDISRHFRGLAADEGPLRVSSPGPLISNLSSGFGCDFRGQVARHLAPAVPDLDLDYMRDMAGLGLRPGRVAVIPVEGSVIVWPEHGDPTATAAIVPATPQGGEIFHGSPDVLSGRLAGPFGSPNLVRDALSALFRYFDGVATAAAPPTTSEGAVDEMFHFVRGIEAREKWTFYSDHLCERFKRETLASLQDSRTRMYLARSWSQQLIATAVLSPIGRGTSDAALNNVYVRAEFRGQGIASRLLEQAIREARQNGFSRILLFADDPAAIRFYRRLGFAVANKADDGASLMSMLLRSPN